MHGLFGEIQISEEAHERCQNPGPIPIGKESQWCC
jgi:hypothetical protein